MESINSDVGLATWVQDAVTFLAVLAALFVPWRQRRLDLADEEAKRTRDEKEHLRRITSGLWAEIDAAVEASQNQQSGVDAALADFDRAKKESTPIKEPGPIRAGTMAITEAVTYRAVAADLGRLPAELVGEITGFYARAREIERIAEIGGSTMDAYKVIQGLGPRIRMKGAMVLLKLDKFRAAEFANDANLKPTREEIVAVSKKVGYPLNKILEERGNAP